MNIFGIYEYETITIQKAFDYAISAGLFYSWNKRKPKPGEIIESCSPEIRDALKNLTSKEASNYRDDYIKKIIDPESLFNKIKRRR